LKIYSNELRGVRARIVTAIAGAFAIGYVAARILNRVTGR